MIEEISIENFKGFAEEQRIPLRPITLLFGANSSGKTTIIQSLLLLKQTLEEAESPETVLLPKGKTIDLGSYKELIYGHDTSRRLRLTYKLTKPIIAASKAAWHTFAQRPRNEDEAIFSPWLRFTFGVEKQKRFKLEQFEIGSGATDKCLALFEPTTPPRDIFHPRMFFFAKRGTIPTAKLFALRSFDVQHPLIAKEWQRFSNSLPKIIDELYRQLKQLNTSLERLSSRVDQRENLSNDAQNPLQARFNEMNRDRRDIEKQMEKFRKYNWEVFISDIRVKNQRSLLSFANFLPSGVIMTERHVARRFTIFSREADNLPEFAEIAATAGSLLRDTLDRTIYLGPLREYPERHYIFSGNVVSDVGKSGKFMPDMLFSNRGVLKKLNDWLTRFQIGYKLTAKTVIDPDVKDVFTLRLTDLTTGVSVSPLDVGFGISQVLPIIVQGVVARNRIILVEQPEIHLHPALQAELGSFFADCISSKQGNQFIIETHSEHLILRLQRLVREKVLKPEDISVVYVCRGQNGATATRLRLDERGDFIDEWPQGFFPERLRELV